MWAMMMLSMGQVRQLEIQVEKEIKEWGSVSGLEFSINGQGSDKANFCNGTTTEEKGQILTDISVPAQDIPCHHLPDNL